MEKRVLDIDQCKELLALGLDMSDASCMFTAVVDNSYNPKSWLITYINNPTPLHILREKYPLHFKEGNVYYTYTLQDILEKLPKFIDYSEDKCYHLDIDFSMNEISYYTYLYDDGLVSFDYENLLDGAFELLKWCIENGYINRDNNESKD